MECVLKMQVTADARPIGVFDSGIGGLTVLKELAHHFPNESFVYLGDTARLPYGSKSANTIRRYSEQNMAYLAKRDVKAIVIACNTASTQVPEDTLMGLPIYNVISPGSQRALDVSLNKRIGILGTRATVASQAYSKKIKALYADAVVIAQACPLFVPLAEEGWDSDPITNLIVYRYVQPLVLQFVDTIVLGCTHYPILKNSISRVVGGGVELVDSGEAIARWMAADFASQKLQRGFSDRKRTITILTTDFSTHFNQLALKILEPFEPEDFHVVDL